MSELETRHYLRNGAETLPEAGEALEWARDAQVAMVDLKFCDLLGTWQHMSLPLRALDEHAFTEGLGFDGSSIRGWQGIAESDMLLMPQADTAISRGAARETAGAFTLHAVIPASWSACNRRVRCQRRRGSCPEIRRSRTDPADGLEQLEQVRLQRRRADDP